MITTTYAYTAGTGFLYDDTKIGFVSSQAELLPGNIPGETYAPTIGSATYNASILTYISPNLEQLDQRPASATFYAAWTSQLNANWSGAGNGSLAVTPVNGAAINGGKLDLTGSTNKNVTFVATNNTDSLENFTLEFQVTPNYTGAPVDDQVFFCTSTFPGNGESNQIALDHYSDGNLYAAVSDSDGNQQVEAYTSFSPTAGQTYAVTFQSSGTTGVSTLFIDGSQVSQMTGDFYTRTATVYGFVGRYNGGQDSNSDFSIANLSFYSAVVAPSSAVLSATIYAAATAVLPGFVYAGQGSLQAYTAFVTTEIGSPHYTLNGLYWDGSAWVASNGTYSQANIASVINSNISTITASNTMQIDVLYGAGNVQSRLSAVTITYTGQGYPISGPTIAPNAPLTMDELSQFLATSTAISPDSVTWYLMIGSQAYWWNGTAWVVSNATLSQSNTADDIMANAATLPITLGSYVTPYAILTSGDGTSTPMLASLALTYDYFGPMPGGPNVCTIFGYIFDEKNAPLVGATVYATNPTTVINQGVTIAQGVRSAVTSSSGYFSISLVETETIATSLNWAVAYTTPQVNNTGNSNPPSGSVTTTFVFGEAVVPNTPEANFSALIFT